MLKRIIKIDNLGVFKKGVQAARELSKVTLLYADNARGKSTFASLCRAAAAGDTTSITSRKTLGSTDMPSINLRFETAGKGFNAEFDGSKWSGQRPNIHVFNQEFVDRNVYTGLDVSPEQRASLLNLALGDAAVAAQTQFNTQSELSRAKAGEVRLAELALVPHRGKIQLDEFIALEVDALVDEKISAVEETMRNAAQIDDILAAPLFKEFPSMVPIKMTGVVRILTSTLQDVHEDAERRVKEHIALHSSDEGWIHQGVNLDNDKNCPYCGQSTADLPLIRAYKDYFSDSYTLYLNEIGELRDTVDAATNLSHFTLWQNVIEFNKGMIGTWSRLVKSAMPTVDVEHMEEVLTRAREGLLALIDKKMANIFAAIEHEEIEALLKDFDTIETMQNSFQEVVRRENEAIVEFQKSLTKIDTTKLQKELDSLKLQKIRHQDVVAQLVDVAIKARSEHKQADSAKILAKETLDKLMADLLGQFQGAINQWLGRFGASFRIEKMETSYAGGDPRGRYSIKVREATVAVGPGKGDLQFHAALSEGDKRTLAFSFFLATLFSDKNHHEATVVLDDVFTSLDRQRRHNTADAAVKIAHECSQLILLGHDAHFLRDVRKRAQAKQVGGTIELCLLRDAQDYSSISGVDLDVVCASDYYKHYVLVETFMEGKVPPERLLEVAIALRPLVEGHLHKSFPKKFPEGLTFGGMLDVIKNAPAATPLVSLQPLLKDLHDFNEYAGAYHHDTIGGIAARTDIHDAELKRMAEGALNFIQTRKLWPH